MCHTGHTAQMPLWFQPDLQLALALSLTEQPDLRPLLTLHVTPGACVCTSHRKAAHILLTTQTHLGWNTASTQFLEESFLVGALLISSIKVQVPRVNAHLFILL